MAVNSSSHDESLVMAASDEESNAIAGGEAERYFAILTDDAVFMPPNLAPMTGAELREWLREFLSSVVVESLAYEHGQTVIAQDLAFHEYACSWKVTPKSGGPPTLPHFKGLHILRRLADGSWRISRNIWNLNPPPTHG